MAVVMPGTVIRFGAEYHRRPAFSLFNSKRKSGHLTVAHTNIRLQACISITREKYTEEENIIFVQEPTETDDRRGQFVDIIT